MNDLVTESLLPQIKNWLEEDDLNRNLHYTRSLPTHAVAPTLKVKSPMVLAGMDYFIAVFAALGVPTSELKYLKEYEGKSFSGSQEINFQRALPFNIVLTAERLALNLLQHASSIATWTRRHVDLAADSGIKILDTRKTTPGLRALEKYAVRVGGGFNHRFGQSDLWMIKDNHKSSLGGLKGALEFFQSQGAFYNNIIAEVHDLAELKTAQDLGMNHVMLDNFSPEDIRTAVKAKKADMTIEVSGGLKLETIKNYLIPGVDALSIGSLTYEAPRVDLSLKFKST